MAICRFNYPSDVSLGPNGTIFVADLHSLRRISMPEDPTIVLGVGFDGSVSTVAGNAGPGEVDGTGREVITQSPFINYASQPFSPAIDTCRRHYLTDGPYDSHAIEEVASRRDLTTETPYRRYFTTNESRVIFKGSKAEIVLMLMLMDFDSRAQQSKFLLHGHIDDPNSSLTSALMMRSMPQLAHDLHIHEVQFLDTYFPSLPTFFK